MDTYLHDGDAHIERKDNVFGDPVAVLCDDGGQVFEFPAEMTDDQIRLALRLANQVYAIGVRVGQHRKVREIKACLGIE